MDAGRGSIVVYVALTIGVVVVGTATGVSVYLRRRLARANEPKCPACRSRDLEGVDRGGEPQLGVLGEEFRCRSCGLAPRELDGEARRLVDALRELQSVEVPLVEAQNTSFGLPTPKSTLGRNRETGDWKENRVLEVWEEMRRVQEEHPEAFEAPLVDDPERTAGELLTSYLQGEERGGWDLALQFIDKEAEEAMRAVRSAIVAQLDQARADQNQ